MTKKLSMLVGAGVGAGLMYLFDPNHGTTRRARLQDQYQRLARKTADATKTAQQDATGRRQGWARSASRWLSGNPEPVSDDKLTQRVRAAIGHVSTHPSSIDVSAQNGRVILRGPVLAEEAPLVVDCAYGVRGVTVVENQMEIHAAAGSIPGLQGGKSPRGRLGQQQWNPATRIAAGVGGGTLALMGLSGGLIRRTAGLAGLALVARATTNLDWRRLTGIGARRRAVDIQKTIFVQAPIERVFEIWANCDNYPNFMTHVRSVRRLGDGRTDKRWRWTVTGPASTEFSFDTVVTAYEANRLIAWRTEPGALIQHEGIVRFSQEGTGATRAQIQMTYNPVAGAVGHTVARLFGADAKKQMDDDLLRMKNYIETGVRPHDAAAASAPRPQLS